MGLSVYLRACRPTVVFESDVTHNLTAMADEAGLYDVCWRPEEIGISKANQLIKPLSEGIKRLEADPERFKKLNPKNGWGSYDSFLDWLKRYLSACEEFPDADVEAYR
jgi:hypothetical protein